jgi:subtilisin family serine protease
MNYMKALALAGLFSLAVLPFATHAQTAQPWMHADVKSAWSQGYKGQGTTITVIDDYTSNSMLTGNFGTGTKTQRHGDFTLLEASMVAPSANMRAMDFGNTGAVGLNNGLNVLNASYGMYAANGYANNQIGWSAREASMISYAKTGAAVVVKAAGNDGVAVTGVNAAGNADYLNRALVGAQSAIFVGALSRNGSNFILSQASMASYSNVAGTDKAVQNNFVVVGVDSSQTRLQGTSFAAPIVSGYVAVLGSKFTQASATQITNQLLNTARTDTIANYNAATHGRGEASLSRALAPVAIR